MSPADPWVVHDLGASAHLLLRGELAPCDQACRFCPRSLVPARGRPPTDVAAIDAVVDAFAAIVAGTTAPELQVVSDDILAFPALGRLLAIASAADKRVVLGTPGVRLDAEAVDLLARHGAEVALTWLAHDDATYARLAGDATAKPRLEAALARLRDRGVPVRMQVVVTADNVDELDALVAHLVEDHGLAELTVHLFFPDMPNAPDGYLDQFPDLGAVERALARIAARGLAPAPTLRLGNLPLCQVDLRATPALDVRPHLHGREQNADGTEGVEVCAACRVRDRCVRLHPAHVARHGVRPVDDAVIAAALAAASEALGRVDGVPPEQGIPPDVGVAPEAGLAPGEGIPRDRGVPPTVGLLPGQGVPRGQGLLPGQAPPDPGDLRPASPPPAASRAPAPAPAPVQGIPKALGVPRSQGRPAAVGVPVRRRPPRRDADRHRWPLVVLDAVGPPVGGLGWSPDGRWLAVARGGGVELHDLHARHAPATWMDRLRRRRRPGPLPARRVLDVAVDACPRFLDADHLLLPATGRADLRVVTLDGRMASRVVTPHDHVHDVTVGPDGTWWVAGDGLTAHARDGRFLRRVLPPDRTVHHVTCAADGAVLAAIRGAPPVLLRGGLPAPSPVTFPALDAAISAGGAWIAALTDDQLHLWHAASGRQRWRRPSGPHLRHLRIAADERYLLATGGAGTPTDGSTLRLWNLDAGAKRADLLGHGHPVTHLALAPDGRRAATADADGAVVLWDLTVEISTPR